MKMSKRLALIAVTAVTAIAPIAATSAAADPPRHSQSPQNSPQAERREDRRDYRRDDRRDDRRDARQEARWDARQHNGYSYNGRWYYGPAPTSYYGRQGFHPGYRAWQRGDRVPAYYRDSAHRVDYRRERLRAPPRGYQYVRDDRGTVLLVGIATGIVLSAILSR